MNSPVNDSFTSRDGKGVSTSYTMFALYTENSVEFRCRRVCTASLCFSCNLITLLCAATPRSGASRRCKSHRHSYATVLLYIFAHLTSFLQASLLDSLLCHSWLCDFSLDFLKRAAFCSKWTAKAAATLLNLAITIITLLDWYSGTLWLASTKAY